MIDEKVLHEEIIKWCKSEIDRGNYKIDTVDMCAMVRNIIDRQPKVGGWIPCSERKPNNDEYDWVLAQVQGDDGFLWIPRVMEYRESKDDWYLDDENPCWLKECHGDAFKVIAWQPLPEPYKESED